VVVTSGLLPLGLAAPAYAAGTNAITSPAAAAVTSTASAPLVLSGTAATGVGAVQVTVDDGNDATDPVSLFATGLDWQDAAQQSWTATFPLGSDPVEAYQGLSSLDDGALTVTAQFRTCTIDGCDASGPTVARAVTLDLVGPGINSFPDGSEPIFARDVVLWTDDGEPFRYTVGTNGAPAGDPATGTLVSADEVLTLAVNASQQVAVRSVDAHGNVTTRTFTFDVVPALATTTTLTASPAGSQEVESPVTLSATVPDAATGQIRFLAGASLLATVPVVNGAASTSTSGLAVGAHTLRAEFVPEEPGLLLGSFDTRAYTIRAKPVVTPDAPAGAGAPAPVPGPVAATVTSRLGKSAVHVGSKAVLTGTVSPAGVTVTLQQRLGTAPWKPLASKAVTGGRYSFALPTAASGRAAYAVTVTGAGVRETVGATHLLAVYRTAVTKVSPSGTESVTVRNTGRVAVNLKNWRLKDASGKTLTLPAYTLRAGATVKIFTGTGTARAGRLYLAKRADVWSSRDTANLFDANGSRVARLTYR
jgi:hypothetical protein